MTSLDPLGQAIRRASDFLEVEAARGFPEARHEMQFPHWAGFSGPRAQQSSESFSRAVIADLLLDAGALGGGSLARQCADIARAQADAVAAARLSDRIGGWSYFPDLPELPPDLDSLAAATRLFARAAPQYLPLAEEPIACALAGAETDGGIRTWIVAPQNDPAALKRMNRGVRWHWGDTVDVEVCARFYLALHSMDAARFADHIHRGASCVAAQQQASGGWSPTWYAGEVYGTTLCAQLMAATCNTAASDRAKGALAALEHDIGGWGTWEPVPLDTAIALGSLAPDLSRTAIQRAVSVLTTYQNPDGSWPGTAWIKMEVGRAMGRVIRTITWQSDTITTAFALRALCAARHGLERAENAARALPPAPAGCVPATPAPGKGSTRPRS